MQISKSLKVNILNIKKSFFCSNDVIVKQFKTGNYDVAVMYLKGMVNVVQLADYVIKPMQTAQNMPKINQVDYVVNNVISFPEVKTESDFSNVINEITKGKVVLIFNNTNKVFVLELDNPKERSLTEPPTSAVLKGPREGFNENIKTNIAVIRKIFCNQPT